MSSPTAVIYSHISAVTEQESPSSPSPHPEKRKALQDICQLISEKLASTTGDSENGGCRALGFSNIFRCNEDDGWVGGWLVTEEPVACGSSVPIHPEQGSPPYFCPGPSARLVIRIDTSESNAYNS